jgi:phosphomannomutase/phosphoglucomutase
MTMRCFKAYDIRGRVPEDLNEDIARLIGRAYAATVGAKQVVIGRDVRLESPGLAEALAQGLREGGVAVIDLGLCGTEEVYFNAFHREPDGVGGGIMITASHNPKGHNGMKLVRQGARPISGDSGLHDIRDMVLALGNSSGVVHASLADLKVDTDKSAYITHLLSYVDLRSLKPLKIVADPGNGAAGPVVRMLAERLPFEFVFINDAPDGNFPSGVPNPLLPEMRQATSRAVIQHQADFGIAWDGDFDRCFLFDQAGNFIEGYYIVGLLAEAFLNKHPGERIIHDPRLTWNTIDVVRRGGGVAIQSKTGHAFIKERMRLENAIYGGEMSAHHYFRDFAYCDSGMIPWLLVAELLCRSGKPLSDLVGDRMAAFPCSGEINYRVTDIANVVQAVVDRLGPHANSIDRTDGVSLEFDRWRFNLRGSNTEPLLRLNVETRGDTAALEQHVSELETLIQGERT